MHVELAASVRALPKGLARFCVTFERPQGCFLGVLSRDTPTSCVGTGQRVSSGSLVMCIRVRAPCEMAFLLVPWPACPGFQGWFGPFER